MDVNKWYCFKQGEEFGKLAKKKTILKYKMQEILNLSEAKKQSDTLQNILDLALQYESNASSIGEVLVDGNEEECRAARLYFVQGFIHGRTS